MSFISVNVSVIQ